MARQTSLVSLKEIGEINLTPLIDLTFILLITFIITFPLIEQGIPIDLPIGEGVKKEEENAISITLDAKGNLYLDDRPLSSSELLKELIHFGNIRPNIQVMVRADEKIEYGRVIEVMNLLKEAKLSRLGLVTKQGKKVPR